MNKCLFLVCLALSFVFQVQAREQISKESKREVREVLEMNEKLHLAFFNQDSEGVHKYSEKMASRIEKMEDQSLKSLLEFSMKQLRTLPNLVDIKEKHQVYHRVSLALIHIINSYDLGEGYNVYSCPMVRKKWVQNSTELARVHNPYAPEMKHCGTQDTHF